MRVAIAQFLVVVFVSLSRANEESDETHYTNSWAVHVNNVDLDGVSELAVKHGFTNLGQIGSLPGYFHFVKKSIKERSKRSENNHAELLLAEPRVKWVKQQRILERSKRNVISDQEDAEREKRDTFVTIQDPFFKDQWYLQNIGQSSGPRGLDINVLPVWGQGYTGKGIVVSILDDGVDYTHPDLKKNYDPDASFDFNDFDPDPKPRSKDPLNCHGTKCAGEIAAEANNGICGVGVSFNASIGGIRMLDGKATDTIEGSSLSYRSDYIDIYTCCWGPKDDGKRFGKPGFLASKALKIGAERGRGGKGNIFVWATGNGGLTDDDCNCDGYTTSIYTVSIGAISDHGLSTYYTETCASTLAVTFSGASHREADENKIITTGLDHKCTKIFKGTSSAAPLASGMLALVLEANPNLTWRDVQHIIVETSQKTSPLDEGWKRNGAGKPYNHKFGFGKLDAMRMIEKAKKWKNVPKQRVCYDTLHNTSRIIPSSGSLIMSSNTSSCAGTSSEIRNLEHVQVKVTLDHRHRGHLSITLISPSGTRSELLKTRRNDHSTSGLEDWIFMTVHCWGEDPRGSWSLIVTDNDRNTREHHVIKAKQGDLEDVTRVVMDDTEKQGPWDANIINEYKNTEQVTPGNQSPQDHILKGMENTMGELIKGNKFKELAKRKKNRHHGTKGVVGNKSRKRHGHAQFKHRGKKHRKAQKHRHRTKKKLLKGYKLTNTKSKDKTGKTDRKIKKKKVFSHSQKKHKYYKHKRHKHKHTKNKKHAHKLKAIRKDMTQVMDERAPLMAEGSLEFPKDKLTPLEAKIAIKALMNPYFRFTTSRIILPKQYQRFLGEVDIKMNLVKQKYEEKPRVLERGRGRAESEKTHQVDSDPMKNDSSKSYEENGNVIDMAGVSKVVKERNQVKNATFDFGAEPFRLTKKERESLDTGRKNIDSRNTSVKMPSALQDNKTSDKSNVYIKLLNSIKSMRRNSKLNSSSQEERIDLLTDEKPYRYENMTSMHNVVGNIYTGSNDTEKVFKGSGFTGSNYTGSKFVKTNFTGTNSTEINFKENNNSIHRSDTFRGNGSENKVVDPDDVPLVIYDAEKKQFAAVSKINGPDETTNAVISSLSQVTGNEVTGTGSKTAGKGSEITETIADVGHDEYSGFVSGSSGVLLGGTGCEDENTLGNKCKLIESQRAEDTNDIGGESPDGVDEMNYKNDVTNSDVINNVSDDAREFLRPQGPQGIKISNNDNRSAASWRMKEPEDNDEGRLAYFLSTGRYQDVPSGRFINVESSPLRTSGQKDQNDPNRPTLRMRPARPEESRTFQSATKYQVVPEGPKPKISPTISNEENKTDSSDSESLEKFATKDFAALENALEKQISRLEKFGDESEASSLFLQRVKDDIKERNVDDLKFLEDEIRHDMRNTPNEQNDVDIDRKENLDDPREESKDLKEDSEDPRKYSEDPGKTSEDSDDPWIYSEDPRKNSEDSRTDSEDPRQYSEDHGKKSEDSRKDSEDPMKESEDSEDSTKYSEDPREDYINQRLERRQLYKSSSKDDMVYEKHSSENDKYGEGNSGILKSWSLILYGT